MRKSVLGTYSVSDFVSATAVGIDLAHPFLMDDTSRVSNYDAKCTYFLLLNVTKTLFIWRKVGLGHPPPEPSLPHVYLEKNVSQVMISCLSQATEISACACSA